MHSFGAFSHAEWPPTRILGPRHDKAQHPVLFVLDGCVHRGSRHDRSSEDGFKNKFADLAMQTGRDRKFAP